jgi:hypothetical protein
MRSWPLRPIVAAQQRYPGKESGKHERGALGGKGKGRHDRRYVVASLTNSSKHRAGISILRK